MNSWRKILSWDINPDPALVVRYVLVRGTGTSIGMPVYNKQVIRRHFEEGVPLLVVFKDDHREWSSNLRGTIVYVGGETVRVS